MTTPSATTTSALTNGSARISRPSKPPGEEARRRRAARPMQVHGGREADAEREDQHEAVADAVERDRGEQDDEGGRAGDDPARDPDAEPAPAARMVGVVAVVVIVRVLVRGRARWSQARAQDADPDQNHRAAPRRGEPRIELLRDEVLREPERDEAEREHADGVRDGHDRAEQRARARPCPECRRGSRRRSPSRDRRRARGRRPRRRPARATAARSRA